MLNTENEQIKFLTFISDMINYWNEEVNGKSQRERLEGLAFSILSHMDGSSGEPHFLIPPDYDSKDCIFFFEK